MTTAPSRLVQLVCAVLAAAGILPWAMVAFELMAGLTEPEASLWRMGVVWVSLLVPIWMGWFACAAWQQRNSSVRPAVLMAAPAVVFTLIVAASPLVGAGP